VRVTCVAVSVFLCIFWGCGCVLGACLYRLSGAHKRHLEERRLAKVLAEQDDDEDNLWIDEDEEAMEDSEEVMMRTWQYRMKEFLASSRATFLILSVVFVDLIVVITSGFLTEYDIKASSTQQKHVDIFSYVVVLFFFFEIVLRIHVWRKVTGNYRAFCTDPLNIIDLLLVIIDVVLEITVLILLSYVEKYQSEEQVSERGGERERERERESSSKELTPSPPFRFAFSFRRSSRTNTRQRSAWCACCGCCGLCAWRGACARCGRSWKRCARTSRTATGRMRRAMTRSSPVSASAMRYDRQIHI
jgi:hypothetical protein